MSDNPLVADRVDSTRWYTGLGLADSVASAVDGIESGSWIDSTIGGVATSLDTLAAVLDPLGAVASWGVAWLLEHVKPLSDALDWLAGDPDQITAYAQTWRNVAAHLGSTAADLRGAVTSQVDSWAGASSVAYRAHVAAQLDAMETLARATGGIGGLVEGAGLLVALVREIVRDLIAEFVATLAVRLPLWTAEAGLTLGAATPLVVSQVGSLVAKWAARIARVVGALIQSFRRLAPMLRWLGDLIDELNAALHRLARRDPTEPPTEPGGSGGPHPDPGPAKQDGDNPPDPDAVQAEEARIRDLGMDPATGHFRQAEAETAVRVEQATGLELRRSVDPHVDWIDQQGATYDAVGNFDGRHFDRQWPNLQTRILDHLVKADYVPVDVSRFSPEQVEQVTRFIQENQLGPRVFMVGD